MHALQLGMHYYLSYIGRDGILFGDLLLTRPREGPCVELELKAASPHAMLVKKADLPSGSGMPPHSLWWGALKTIWPDAKRSSSDSRAVFNLPVKGIISSFCGRSASEAAITNLVEEAGIKRKLYPNSWAHKAAVGAIDAGRLTLAWVDERDKRRIAAKRRAMARTDPIKRTNPKLCWEFLDLIALSHWPEFVGLNRHEVWCAKMRGIVGRYSTTEGHLLGIETISANCPPRLPLVHYITARSLPNIKGGPLSVQERQQLTQDTDGPFDLRRLGEF